jgi:polyphosphate kinase 2 (PPK2 family)
MAKSRKQQKTGGEVLRNAKEITQIEQYWHVLGRAKPRKPPKDYNYVEELAHLQLELIKLQEWVHRQGLRLCVIF